MAMPNWEKDPRDILLDELKDAMYREDWEFFDWLRKHLELILSSE